MTQSHTLRDMHELLDKVSVVETDLERSDLITSLRSRDRTVIVSFFNQYAFNLAFSQPRFRKALALSDLLLRDGVGVEICQIISGRRPGKNINGTDFIPLLLKALSDERVALFGTTEDWLPLAVDAVKRSGVRHVDSLHGFHSTADYVNAVSVLDPDVIILGMGMPRQELLAAKLARVPGRARVIVNGGAILDFYAGRFPRAPRWMRQARLEWLYRFRHEPRRLARRYFVGGILFFWHVAQLWATKKSGDRARSMRLGQLPPAASSVSSDSGGIPK